MEHKYYRLGDLVFCAKSPFRILDNSVFECEESAPDYEININVDPSFTPDSSCRSYGNARLQGKTIYLTLSPAYARTLSDFSLFNAFDLIGLLLENSRFVLHASFVLHNGEAILFTGASGIGKSTQAELWNHTRGADIVNGDRTLISFLDGKAVAHGFINCGSSGICKNISAPIKTVVILSQSTENAVWEPDGIEAFKALICQGAYEVTSRRQVEKIVSLIAEFTSNVKILRLDCTNTPSAVECLERYI